MRTGPAALLAIAAGGCSHPQPTPSRPARILPPARRPHVLRRRFGLPEFTMLHLFLLAARNVFAAFDPQRTGRISLDYSQFVYCAALTK